MSTMDLLTNVDLKNDLTEIIRCSPPIRLYSQSQNFDIHIYQNIMYSSKHLSRILLDQDDIMGSRAEKLCIYVWWLF